MKKQQKRKKMIQAMAWLVAGLLILGMAAGFLAGI